MTLGGIEGLLYHEAMLWLQEQNLSSVDAVPCVPIVLGRCEELTDNTAGKYAEMMLFLPFPQHSSTHFRALIPPQDLWDRIIVVDKISGKLVKK